MPAERIEPLLMTAKMQMLLIEVKLVAKAVVPVIPSNQGLALAMRPLDEIVRF
jgi:hypothetical protein